jgi:hypothetical protein
MAQAAASAVPDAPLSGADAAEDAAAAADAQFTHAMATLWRSPRFLRAVREARTLGDATVLHAAMEQMRRASPRLHAALAAHPGTFLRAMNRDEQPSRDGSTAELRELWAFVARIEREAQRRRQEAAARGTAAAAQPGAAAAQPDTALPDAAAQRVLTVATAAQPYTPAAAGCSLAAPQHAAAGAPGGLATGGSGPPPGVQRFVGVVWSEQRSRWVVHYTDPTNGMNTQLRASFPLGKEAAAARAYDAVLRAAGGTCVNFPRPGTAETQAVFGGTRHRLAVATPGAAPAPGVGPAAGASHPAAAGLRPPSSRPAGTPFFRGVRWQADSWKWRVVLRAATGKKRYVGTFAADAAVEAAHAYDAAVRAAGGTCVNFPLLGTAETQATRGQRARTGGFIGVRTQGRRYGADARVGGRSHWLGTFDTAEEAAHARDRFLRDAGAPAWQLNFPDAAAHTSHEPPPADSAPVEAVPADSAAARLAAELMDSDDDGDDAGIVAGGAFDSDDAEAAWLE